jgi:hypothetical protein
VGHTIPHSWCLQSALFHTGEAQAERGLNVSTDLLSQIHDVAKRSLEVVTPQLELTARHIALVSNSSSPIDTMLGIFLRTGRVLRVAVITQQEKMEFSVKVPAHDVTARVDPNGLSKGTARKINRRELAPST